MSVLLSYLVLLLLFFYQQHYATGRVVFVGAVVAFTGMLLWQQLAGMAGLALLAGMSVVLLNVQRLRSVARVAAQFYLLVVPLLIVLMPALAFERIALWGPAPLYESGKAFWLTLSSSKVMIVLVILVAIKRSDIASIDRKAMRSALLVSAGIVMLALLAGFEWIPKWGDYLIIFAVTNLVVTVVSEELYFRVLLQNTLEQWMGEWFVEWTIGKTLAKVISALAVAVFFYVAHGLLLPGDKVSGLYLTTAIAYAVFYAYYRNIMASIALHFLVNLFSIVFLAYPFL